MGKVIERIVGSILNLAMSAFWILGGVACFAVGSGVLTYALGAGALLYGLYGLWIVVSGQSGLS